MVTSSRSRRSSLIVAVLVLLAVLAMPAHASAAPAITAESMPAAADAGETVHILVRIVSDVQIRNADSVILYYYNPGTGQESWVPMNLTAGNLTDGEWAFDIPAQSWGGEIHCQVTATDNAYGQSSYPSSGLHVITIVGEERPEPFPWNIVLIVSFLGAALVLTELVFKPGLYRPTGRERARELEEEDWEREEAERESLEKDGT